jgi:hypothetical protein
MPFGHAAALVGDLVGRVGVAGGSFATCEDRARFTGAASQTCEGIALAHLADGAGALGQIP